MDTRNSYRIVKRYCKDYDGNYWVAQYRPWWWPFYCGIATHGSFDAAQQTCHRHAGKWANARAQGKPEVTKMGKLP